MQADKFRAEGLVIEKAGVDRAEHGIQREDAENNHGGSDENIAPQVFIGKLQFMADWLPLLFCAVHSPTSQGCKVSETANPAESG